VKKFKLRMDTHKRSIYKTITWRIIATVTTVVVIYIWTKSWSISLISGIVANLIKTVFYYIHERLWNRTDYGRLVAPVKEHKLKLKNKKEKKTKKEQKTK
jgi:uncharacterized membrane protein